MQELTYTISIIGCLCIVQDVGYGNLKIKLMINSDFLNTWVKVFKNGTSKFCGRQPLKNLKWYGLPRQILLGLFLNTLARLILSYDHNFLDSTFNFQSQFLNSYIYLSLVLTQLILVSSARKNLLKINCKLCKVIIRHRCGVSIVNFEQIQ